MLQNYSIRHYLFRIWKTIETNLQGQIMFSIENHYSSFFNYNNVFHQINTLPWAWENLPKNFGRNAYLLCYSRVGPKTTLFYDRSIDNYSWCTSHSCDTVLLLLSLHFAQILGRMPPLQVGLLKIPKGQYIQYIHIQKSINFALF